MKERKYPMKRITILLIVLLLSLAFTSVVLAKGPSRPGEPLFTLQGSFNPQSLDPIPLGPDDTCKHIKMLDFHATGDVVFAGDYFSSYEGATFEYWEKIDINPNPEDKVTTSQGDLTLCFDKTCNQSPLDTIQIRFVGKSQIEFELGTPDSLPFPCFPPTGPGITVTDQPWVIIGGTGAFAGTQGNGTRNNTSDACTPSRSDDPLGFCVVYSGEIK
jgi:hypothetical protein